MENNIDEYLSDVEKDSDNESDTNQSVSSSDESIILPKRILDNENDEDEYYNNDDDDDDIENYKNIQQGGKNNVKNDEDDEDDDDEDYDEDEEDEDDDEEYRYDDEKYQKINEQMKNNYIEEYHPECKSFNYQEIAHLSTVIRNNDNLVIDPLHKTLPILTKYEKTRILGIRTKQLETGAKPFITLPQDMPAIIDMNLIAEMELKQSVLPFIVKRGLPNGSVEFWKLKDLEVL